MYATLSPIVYYLTYTERRYDQEMRDKVKAIEVGNRLKLRLSQKKYAEAPKVKKYHNQQNK